MNMYERKVTPVERLFTRSPFSTVAVVARIMGNVSEEMLQDAVNRVQQRHRNLQVRISDDDAHDPWFTTEAAGRIRVEVAPRESDDHWIAVHGEASQVPFEFGVRPAIRFILVQSPAVSEVIILCHHILCDGMSLAYLARDLMHHLGDPARAVDVLPDPVPIDLDNMPADITVNRIARFFINRMNKKWAAERVSFDQADYEALSETYWRHYRHRMLTVELSEAQTTALVARCRQEGVTVNSALTAAMIGAQTMAQGEKPYHAISAVAASVRERLPRPAGEQMGFFAGLVTLKRRYDAGASFWENARQIHRKLPPMFTDKNLFEQFSSWCHLDPSILEAIHFKRLGGLVSQDNPRYKKLSDFSRRDDVVQSLLKRGKMDSLDTIATGAGITNLTRLDFPRQYGDLELDRLFMHPGGAFPLATINVVLGAVTCAGKLSLLFEYAEEAVDTATMEKVRDQTMAFLLDGDCM